MSTVISIQLPRERRRFFESDDGAFEVVKTENEVIPLELDWVEYLDDDETISASVWTDSGVTTSAGAIDGSKTTCTVSDTGGETVNKITTSLGYVWERVVRFTAPRYQP